MAKNPVSLEVAAGEKEIEGDREAREEVVKQM